MVVSPQNEADVVKPVGSTVIPTKITTVSSVAEENAKGTENGLGVVANGHGMDMGTGEGNTNEGECWDLRSGRVGGMAQNWRMQGGGRDVE